MRCRSMYLSHLPLKMRIRPMRILTRFLSTTGIEDSSFKCFTNSFFRSCSLSPIGIFLLRFPCAHAKALVFQLGTTSKKAMTQTSRTAVKRQKLNFVETAKITVVPHIAIPSLRMPKSKLIAKHYCHR